MMKESKARREECIREKFTKRIIAFTAGMSREEIEAYIEKYNGYLSYYDFEKER